MNKNSILQKIKNEKIKPKARWRFLATRILFGALLLGTIFVGAAAVSIIFFSLSNINYTPTSVIRLVPIIWLIMFVLFIFLSSKILQNTEKVYKFAYGFVITATLLVTLLCGLVFHFSNLGSRFEEKLMSIDSYETVEERIAKTWNAPTEGYLTGLINRVDFINENIELKDRSGKIWNVDYSNIGDGEKRLLKRVDEIRVIGSIAGLGLDKKLAKEVGRKIDRENVFEACAILPVDIKGKRPPRENNVLRSISELEKSTGKEVLFKKENIKQNLESERIRELIRSKKCK